VNILEPTGTKKQHKEKSEQEEREEKRPGIKRKI
jgi:hypothetical protein